MRKSLWIMLAVMFVAVSAPVSHADTVTLDVSGGVSPVQGSCSGSGCTLGGDIVINNTTGTVISIDVTVAGASPAVGPFNGILFFHASSLTGFDGSGDILSVSIAPGTWVGYTGGAFSGGIVAPGKDLFSITDGVFTPAVAAPEPSSVALMLLGVGLVLLLRRRIGQRFVCFNISAGL